MTSSPVGTFQTNQPGMLTSFREKLEPSESKPVLTTLQQALIHSQGSGVRLTKWTLIR